MVKPRSIVLGIVTLVLVAALGRRARRNESEFEPPFWTLVDRRQDGRPPQCDIRV